MFQVEPQSPFLKNVPENEQTFFKKKIGSMLQVDKENVISQDTKIQVSKMQIGQGQIDGFLINVADFIRISKDMVRDLFKGLEKHSKAQRCLVGLLGHRPHPISKGKSILSEKQSQPQKSTVLLNLNILLKLKAQEYPYVSMFACDCLMSILRLYIEKKTDYKVEDLRMKWKYDFLLEDKKIGEILVINDLRGEDVYSNIAIRMKLTNITSDEQAFSRDLLQQFATRLNISKNLRQSAAKIRQTYEEHLMFIGEEVLIKRRQPNQWEDIVSGTFMRVNEVGHAILKGIEGNQEEIEEGLMELRESVEDLEEQERQEEKLEGIGF